VGGKTAYCFIENEYKGEAVEFKMDDDPNIFMKQSEEMSQDNPLIRKIFEAAITAEREAENFLLDLSVLRAISRQAWRTAWVRNAMLLANLRKQRRFIVFLIRFSRT
jgi:hypothetical protein